MNRAEAIREAEGILRQRRELALDDAQRRRDAAFEGDAALAALYGRMNGVFYEAFLKGVENMHRAAALIEGAKGEYAKLSRAMDAMLAERGMEADALQPRFACPLCEDKGYADAPGGRCSCLEKLADSLTEGAAVSLEGSFETFDETIFPDTPMEGGGTQRALMRAARRVCMEYAQDYPKGKLNLVLMGKSGLGKTFLLNSALKRVEERGVRTVKTSAFAMQRTMRDYHFGKGTEGFERLLYAPILGIDDLGAEPMMENITVEYLFNLINERRNARLGTVISTNLNAAEFIQRYTERISSRLLTPDENSLVGLVGEDVRRTMGRGR